MKNRALIIFFSAGTVFACPFSLHINNVSFNAGVRSYYGYSPGLNLFLEREISNTRKLSYYRAFSIHYDRYKGFQSAGLKVNMFNLSDVLDCRNIGKILSPGIAAGSRRFEGSNGWYLNVGADLKIFNVSPDNYTFYRLNISYGRSLIKSPVRNYFALTMGIALNVKGLKPRRGNRSGGGMNF